MFSSPENPSTEFMHDSLWTGCTKSKICMLKTIFVDTFFFSFRQAGSSAFIQNDVMTTVEQYKHD
jgi:hypothetical protein